MTKFAHQYGASNVWFNLPGIVAAYQPIAAPERIGARQNVGQGRLGSYTAKPGTAPTWDAATGWQFNNSNMYLDTGIKPPNTGLWSAIVRFAGGGAADEECVFGLYDGDPRSFNIYSRISAAANSIYYRNGNSSSALAPYLAAGILGFAGNLAFRNGSQEAGTIGAPSGNITHTILLGACNQSTIKHWFSGSIQAFAVYSRTLTTVEMWQITQQMKYCEQNADWNAWARRRNYWIVPAAPTFQAAWAQRNNTLLGGGTD